METWVLISIRFEAAGYIPKLPLRMRPDNGGKEVSPLPGKNCEDWDCCRGRSSRVLGLVEVLCMLLILDVEVRAGVRDGSGSSPPRITGLGWSFNEVCR